MVKTRTTRWPILGNVVAALSTLLATVAGAALFYAYVFSGGNDVIPQGSAQLIVWFVLPASALLAAAIAIRQAIRAADHGGGLMWAFFADAVSVAALVAWWLYVGTLTG